MGIHMLGTWLSERPAPYITPVVLMMTHKMIDFQSDESDCESLAIRAHPRLKLPSLLTSHNNLCSSLLLKPSARRLPSLTRLLPSVVLCPVGASAFSLPLPGKQQLITPCLTCRL